jgi:hypothetical protein
MTTKEYKIFDEDGVTGKGDKYGIQIYSNDLKKVLKILLNTCIYHNIPMISHLGNTFNFINDNNLLIIYDKKFWDTEITEFGKLENYESFFNRKEKLKLIEITTEICNELGIKIIDMWNHDNKCCHMSIETNLQIKYDANKNASNEEIKEFCKLLNSFSN